MKVPILIALMFVACASRQSVTEPVAETKYETVDTEVLAAEYFQKGKDAESLCEKGAMFEEAVNMAPDSKPGKMAASHLKRIDAKYNSHIKKTVALYRDMVKAGYSGSELIDYRARIAVQTSDCSYRPAVERMEKALDEAAEKYRGKNVTY